MNRVKILFGLSLGGVLIISLIVFYLLSQPENTTVLVQSSPAIPKAEPIAEPTKNNELTKKFSQPIKTDIVVQDSAPIKNDTSGPELWTKMNHGGVTKEEYGKFTSSLKQNLKTGVLPNLVLDNQLDTQSSVGFKVSNLSMKNGYVRLVYMSSYVEDTVLGRLFIVASKEGTVSVYDVEWSSSLEVSTYTSFDGVEYLLLGGFSSKDALLEIKAVSLANGLLSFCPTKGPELAGVTYLNDHIQLDRKTWSFVTEEVEGYRNNSLNVFMTKPYKATIRNAALTLE